MSVTELTRLTLAEARDGLRKKDFSATELTQAFLQAIERVLSDERVKTPDLGGKATTAEMTKAVTSAMAVKVAG